MTPTGKPTSGERARLLALTAEPRFDQDRTVAAMSSAIEEALSSRFAAELSSTKRDVALLSSALAALVFVQKATEIEAREAVTRAKGAEALSRAAWSLSQELRDEKKAPARTPGLSGVFARLGGKNQ